jgi:peptidoglycan/LPS O-acetylase OafA/YrhL
MRTGKRIRTNNAFLISSVLLIAILSFPRLGGPERLWMNGLYESFCIIVLFPVIVAMGAGAGTVGKVSSRACQVLGDISYPLYITHYPLIYVYTAWVTRDKIPASYGAPVGVLLLFTSIAIAYACLKFYDEPVREWLTRRFLAKRSIGEKLLIQPAVTARD